MGNYRVESRISFALFAFNVNPQPFVLARDVHLVRFGGLEARKAYSVVKSSIRLFFLHPPF